MRVLSSIHFIWAFKSTQRVNRPILRFQVQILEHKLIGILDFIRVVKMFTRQNYIFLVIL